MSVKNFIPMIWSARLLENLQKALVYGQLGVINHDYEGEISAYGDTVKINGISPVTVGDYERNKDMNAPEELADKSQVLTIDQSKYFNFQVDDCDKKQTNPKLMDAAMREASYAIGNTVDQFIASLYTGVAAANTIGTDDTPVVPTKTDAYEYLVDLSVKLDEANVPQAGRWVILPPWFEGLMLKDDRFVRADTYASNVILQNGEIGRAAGFTVLKSNNVPNVAGAKYKIMAGHGIAITYAAQINEVEAYRMEKRFADAVKGLNLYGGKLVRPDCIAVLTANKK